MRAGRGTCHALQAVNPAPTTRAGEVVRESSAKSNAGKRPPLTGPPYCAIYDIVDIRFGFKYGIVARSQYRKRTHRQAEGAGRAEQALRRGRTP
jgi:hypothetical protein